MATPIFYELVRVHRCRDQRKESGMWLLGKDFTEARGKAFLRQTLGRHSR